LEKPNPPAPFPAREGGASKPLPASGRGLGRGQTPQLMTSSITPGRGEQERCYIPIPQLRCNKNEVSSVLPPLVGGNEGGPELGLGDEGEMLALY